MTDNTELKRMAEACVAAGEYLPGEAWEEDRSYCQAEVAFLEFAPVATPAAVLALITERDQLKAENEALRKNAERYQWLREARSGYIEVVEWIGPHATGMTGEDLDALIDAAMGKGEQS